MSHAYPVQFGLNSSSFFPVLCFTALISDCVEYLARPAAVSPLTSPLTGVCSAQLRFSHDCWTGPLSSEVRTLQCSHLQGVRLWLLSPTSSTHLFYHLYSEAHGGDHLSPSSTVTMTILATPSVTYGDSKKKKKKKPLPLAASSFSLNTVKSSTVPEILDFYDHMKLLLGPCSIHSAFHIHHLIRSWLGSVTGTLLLHLTSGRTGSKIVLLRGQMNSNHLASDSLLLTLSKLWPLSAKFIFELNYS